MSTIVTRKRSAAANKKDDDEEGSSGKKQKTTMNNDDETFPFPPGYCEFELSKEADDIYNRQILKGSQFACGAPPGDPHCNTFKCKCRGLRARLLRDNQPTELAVIASAVQTFQKIIYDHYNNGDVFPLRQGTEYTCTNTIDTLVRVCGQDSKAARRYQSVMDNHMSELNDQRKALLDRDYEYILDDKRKKLLLKYLQTLSSNYKGWWTASTLQQLDKAIAEIEEETGISEETMEKYMDGYISAVYIEFAAAVSDLVVDVFHKATTKK